MKVSYGLYIQIGDSAPIPVSAGFGFVEGRWIDTKVIENALSKDLVNPITELTGMITSRILDQQPK